MLLCERDRSRLFERIRACYERSFGSIAIDREHIDRMALDTLSEQRSRDQLCLVEKSIGHSLNGLRTLEVGSGCGMTLAVAIRLFGARAVGLEPGGAEYEGTLQIAADLLESCGIPRYTVQAGVGEHMPYDDSVFDVVYSSNVLEHVSNPERVLDEAIRVLRPGGIGHFVAPNYASWWEGHYGIVWLPNLSLGAAKIYVRLLRRDPSFLDTLQFLTPSRLEQALARYGSRVEVMGWGQDIWEERVRTLHFSEYAALGRLKRILAWIHRAQAAGVLIALGKRLRWETPIVLTFRKI